MKTEKRNTSSEHTFMSGVLVLTVSTVIVKIIGLAYKIPLIGVLGAEGMGYFNTAYEIFALLCGISTSGLPVAVSMLVSSARESGNFKRADGIYKTSSALLLTKGVLFCGGLAMLAEPVARAVGNPQAYFAILAISPALLFTCASGAVRGYFQGCRIMTPTAVSQLIEAFGKLVFGVCFAAAAYKAGMSIPTCAAFGVLGVSLGSFISVCYLWIKKRRDAKQNTVLQGSLDGAKGYVLALFKISLPITLCSALIGTTRIIDMTLMLRRLGDIGIDSAQANRIYGAYTTLALPIFGLVPAFIPPITESLIPRLAAAVESGSVAEQKRAVKGAMRLTAFVAMPASFGIAVYSRQILELLFKNQERSIDVCAPLLSALGASVLFSCLISTTNAVLQSYKKVFLPIISLAAGAAVKAVFAYTLIGIPEIAQMGAPLSTLASNATVIALNAVFLKRTASGAGGILSSSWKPFIASVAAIGASKLVYDKLAHGNASAPLPFLCALAIAAVLYLTLATALGVVGKDDIIMFSKKAKQRR